MPFSGVLLCRMFVWALLRGTYGPTDACRLVASGGVLADGRGSRRIAVANPGATSIATPAVAVAKLGRLYLPDAVVTVPRAVSTAQLAGLKVIPGIQGVLAVLRGTTTLGGRPVRVLAADPGSLRAFTPRPTAASDALWQVPARGEAIAPWGVLAGIGQVETDHGPVKAVSSAGAMGPMQFLPSTFAIYGVDGDGDGKANILDQPDAVYSAARYLCASGGGPSDTLYDAIFAYNHSDYYVKTVLGLAAQYR